MWARSFLLAIASLLAGVGAASVPGPATVSVQRGSALFNGREALSGRIRGHDEPLPPEAVRCVNCHGAAARGSTRISRAVAPHLDRAFLLEFQQRRGGPPSRYDQAAFCTLLRSGVDPAQVLIAREMPTYDMDEAQCSSLWSFLMRNEGAGKQSTGNGDANAQEKR